MCAPPSYKTPDRRRMSGEIVTACFLDVKAKVENFLKSIETTKGTLTADGMTHMKVPYENYMLMSGHRKVFLGCDDATGHLEEGGLRDANFIADGIIEVMEDIGAELIVHVVLDGASNNGAARQMLEHKYPHVVTSHCLMHNVNLFFGDVKRRAPGVDEVLRIKDNIVEFIHSSLSLHAVFEKHVKEHNHGRPLEFIKGSTTRMGKEFIELHRFRRLMKPLKALASAPSICEYDNYRVLTDFIDDIKVNEKKIDDILRLLYPTYNLLRVSDVNNSPISKIYPYVQKITSHLSEMESHLPYGHVVLGIWNDRFGNYCGDLHVVAYILDPCFIAEVHASTEDITTPLMAITEKFAPVIFPKDRDIIDIQAAIMSQWSSYKNKASGLFCKEVTWKSASTMPPLDWWGVYGTHCPELRSLAVCVLSQHVSANNNEKAWSGQKFIKSKRRGRLAHDVVEKSQFVSINSHLEDPIEPDSEEYILQQWEQADKALEDLIMAGKETSTIDVRPVWKCWEEDWEAGARSNTPVNYFKVKEKYLGIYLYEDDDDTWPDGAHYVIRDVYWERGARGDAKVWRADCVKVVLSSANNGAWIDDCDSDGKPYNAVKYYLNSSIFPVIWAARDLNSAYNMLQCPEESTT